MKQSILVWPEDRLLIKSEQFDGDVDASVEDLIRSLVATLTACKQGVGLSAIQIGVPERIFVMRAQDARRIKVVANPTYVGEGEKTEKMEGCLSFLDNYVKAPRYEKIQAKYLSINPITFETKEVEETQEGLEAQCFQHESEHMDGETFLKYTDARDAKRVAGRLKKWKAKGWIYP